MQANDLLMDDDRYKWYLLQYLELNKNAYCSVDQLGDILKISRYKLEKYLQELQDELKENHYDATIELLETGEIEVQQLTHAIVKKMRLYLVERSLTYKIFHGYVTNETSLDKQIEELHVSRSSTYRLYKRLKDQLVEEGFQLKKNQLIGEEDNETSLDKQIEELHVSRSSTYRLYKRLKDQLVEEGFQLKKNQLIGEEDTLRNFLFGLYYEIFNGLASPFDDTTQHQAKELFRYLEHYLNLSLPKTKEHKLQFFISIALVRMSKAHLMDREYLEYVENDATEYLNRWLDSHFSLTNTEKRREIAALLLFCQLMEIDLPLETTILEGKEMRMAENLVDEFLQYLASHSRFEINQLKEDKELVAGLLRINRRWLIYHFRESTFVTKIQRRYFQEINPKLDELIQDFKELVAGLLRINRRWLIYHFRESTFVTKIQRRYFQEINPKLDELIQDFIEKVAHRGIFHSDQERNKLYYDYLFFMITQISVDELEAPVFICIDFSHGSSYNEYIQTMLSSLQSMNICYEEKLSTKTQIYLSDFLIETLPCHQMIWKRPPTPEDWSEFGHLLLTVKGGAYE